MYKVVAYTRWHKGEQYLDMFVCARWPAEMSNDALQVAATLNETTMDGWLEQAGFDEALQLVNSYRAMQMRARFGMCDGPYIINSPVPLTREEALVHVLAMQKGGG